MNNIDSELKKIKEIIESCIQKKDRVTQEIIPPTYPTTLICCMSVMRKEINKYLENYAEKKFFNPSLTCNECKERENCYPGSKEGECDYTPCEKFLLNK
jgi:hypothetical protein